jgi:hypothetical protein
VSAISTVKPSRGLNRIVIPPVPACRGTGAKPRDLQFLFTVRRGRVRLLHVVFDSLDRVAKNLFQAHGRQAVSLAEVFVDLIPVIHPWSGKAN